MCYWYLQWNCDCCKKLGENSDRILCTQKSLIKTRFGAMSLFFFFVCVCGGGGFVDTRHKENRKRIGHLRPVHILQKQNVKMLHAHNVYLHHISFQDTQCCPLYANTQDKHRKMPKYKYIPKSSDSHRWRISACLSVCLAHTPACNQILIWMSRGNCWWMTQNYRQWCAQWAGQMEEFDLKKFISAQFPLFFLYMNQFSVALYAQELKGYADSYHMVFSFRNSLLWILKPVMAVIKMAVHLNSLC